MGEQASQMGVVEDLDGQPELRKEVGHSLQGRWERNQEVRREVRQGVHILLQVRLVRRACHVHPCPWLVHSVQHLVEVGKDVRAEVAQQAQLRGPWPVSRAYAPLRLRAAHPFRLSCMRIEP